MKSYLTEKLNFILREVKFQIMFSTVSFKDLDWGRKIMIFESILTTYETSLIFFWGSLGSSKNWLELKNWTTKSKFRMSESVEHAVGLLKTWKSIFVVFRIQRPPLYRITLDQHENDDKKQMIGPKISCNNKRRILLRVI
jgi:hypothetical protein